MSDVETAVMEFLAEIPTDRPISRETELMEQGILDSTSLVRLILFLESRFRILIDDSEIAPESFASVAAIGAFVQRKRAAAA